MANDKPNLNPRHQYGIDSNSQDVMMYLQEFRMEFNNLRLDMEKRMTRMEDYLSGNRYDVGQNVKMEDINERLMRLEAARLPEEQVVFIGKTYSSARSWKAIGGVLFTLIMAMGGAVTTIYYAIKIIFPKFF